MPVNGGDNNEGGNNPNNPPPPNPPDEVDYDLAETPDAARALEASGRIALQINLEDISFWFSNLESEMLLAGVGSQWLKLSVLRKNLPVKQREDVKSLLRLKKSEAGRTPYYDTKMQLIRIYEVKAKDRFKKALSRVLTGLPSQLGNQLIEDVCKNGVKLRGCCCADVVHALWTNQLPVAVNNHISNMDFTFESYLQVFDAADKVFLSSRTLPAVAAVAAPHPGYSIAADEQSPLNTAFQAAAISAPPKKNNRPWKNKNKNQQNSQDSAQNEGQGQNKNQKPRKGPRHSSNPPHSCCDNHFVHGDQAYFCQAPFKCPWKNKLIERP